MADKIQSNTLSRLDPNNIYGHADFKMALAAARTSERIHHAWLLTGPKGIGKASMAYIAAAWLLCDAAPPDTLFGDVPADFSLDLDDTGTKQVLNGAHPDFMAIYPREEDNKSGQIKIDQIRAMHPFMMHKPGRGKMRVAVIDSMDEINRNGANAMLKLLEEPPENTVIFLISSRPGHLPATILSRCRMFKMPPLGDDDCRNALASIWPDADENHINLLVHLCDGAPGRAVSLAQSGSADCYQAVCALMASQTLDIAALSTLCGKWGKGAAAGRETREGAVYLLERLLSKAARCKASATSQGNDGFETPVLNLLCERHSATHLAELHHNFMTAAIPAEALYLDFPHFLLRQIMQMHQKQLP
ncbi:MAG: DNA polymerase III subunit delta' [Candidatus Puniceispirillum sp.]|jgi:DNA polymerase III subunit delta'|uniref:DNA polymerase III subunit delta' n=1 Tax=Candidatus Puniceispirillum sp. TaxID=2026719 RepID=UPI001ED37637|nr:DNA polymerase III subunit delta' [Candidatus Puniceispirillum sp.]MBT6416344.1 DNA polymerase III subunit delta' [Candidatus Puniceispirillum sp.]MBT6565422.1 DNA polymerase III subunit delta' [Candidatus Puniceispirillum sp.]